MPDTPGRRSRHSVSRRRLARKGILRADPEMLDRVQPVTPVTRLAKICIGGGSPG